MFIVVIFCAVMGVKTFSLHQPLFENVEHVILVGSTWKSIQPSLSVDTWQKALVRLHSVMNENDWSGILVKGSNSIGLSNIVKDLLTK